MVVLAKGKPAVLPEQQPASASVAVVAFGWLFQAAFKLAVLVLCQPHLDAGAVSGLVAGALRGPAADRLSFRFGTGRLGLRSGCWAEVCPALPLWFVSVDAHWV